MDEKAVWDGPEGTLIRVHVKTHSRRGPFIAGIEEAHVLINLQSMPKEGKANRELIKNFSDVLSVSSSQIIILAGHTSKEKTLLIQGMSAKEVLLRLRQAAEI